MSARTDVLLWAQRTLARKTAPAHQILDIAAGAGLTDAQEAFHKIARLAHPDLHRTTLSSEELELVTTAYARAASAYQEIRSQNLQSGRMRTLRGPGSESPTATTGVIPTSPLVNKPTPTREIREVRDELVLSPAQAMTSKALTYYRKAELCLRRGELTAAVLQLKMAIASDPQSQFLRNALSEVESELVKMP